MAARWGTSTNASALVLLVSSLCAWATRVLEGDPVFLVTIGFPLGVVVSLSLITVYFHSILTRIIDRL